MTEEKQGDWWRLKILVWIAALLLVGWLIVEVFFAWLNPVAGKPFSTINSSLRLNPTLDPSKCIEWGKIDGSYLGEAVCVRGTVQAVSNGQDGTPLLFSTEPKTLYIAFKATVYFSSDSKFYGPVYHQGDCVMADGRILTDSNRTLYVEALRTALCP